jgi:hypothetical protein
MSWLSNVGLGITGAVGDFGDWVDESWDDISGTTAAEEQAAAVERAAEEDRAYAHPDVTNPLGSQTITRDPVTGKVSVNTSLSPEQQALVSSLRGDFGTGRQSVEDALYSRATSRLDPQWQQREDANRTRLYNMGLREGDKAFDQQVSNLGMERNDAYSAARNQAITAGGQEQSRLLSAIMGASNPGLAGYYGENGAVDASIAQGNIMANTTNPLEAIIAAWGAYNS